MFGKQVQHILNIGTSTRPTDKKQNYENLFTVLVTVLWTRIRIQSGPNESGSGIRKAKWSLEKNPGLDSDTKLWLNWMYLFAEPEFAGDVKKSNEANPEYCDVCDRKYSSLSEFAMNSGMGKDRDWDPKIGRCREGGGGPKYS